MRSSASSSPSQRRLPFSVAAALLAALSAAACGSGGGALTVRDAWVRATSNVAGESAGYLVISNPGSQVDTLTDVFSPDAASIEIHEPSTDSSGMTGMEGIESVEIPAGGSVTFAPGGGHLMIMGLHRTLAAGGTLEIHLQFEHAGTIVVQAAIRAA